MVSPNRKQRIVMNEEKFNLIVKFYTTKSTKDLVEMTNLSKSAINKCIKKIEDNIDSPEFSFKSLFKCPGRKRNDKSELHRKIIETICDDNTLTQNGCKRKLGIDISDSQMSKEFKNAGLTRKRLKKRSKTILTQSNILLRREFSINVSALSGRRLLFLDESGFNLHTSTHYGYSLANTDAIMYHSLSKGKNISLCAFMSANEILHHKLIDGAYNTGVFGLFLAECRDRGNFSDHPVLIMDNVRFHHSNDIRIFSRKP